MMIRLRGGGRGAGAGKTSRVEICNAVVDRARVRTASTRSAPARPAKPADGASTGAGQRTRPIRYQDRWSPPTDCPRAAAWA